MKIEFTKEAWDTVMKVSRSTGNPPHITLNKLLENIDENDANEVVKNGRKCTEEKRY